MIVQSLNNDLVVWNTEHEIRVLALRPVIIPVENPAAQTSDIFEIPFRGPAVKFLLYVAANP